MPDRSVRVALPSSSSERASGPLFAVFFIYVAAIYAGLIDSLRGLDKRTSLLTVPDVG